MPGGPPRRSWTLPWALRPEGDRSVCLGRLPRPSAVGRRSRIRAGVRDTEAGERVAEDSTETTGSRDVHVARLDLADPASIADFTTAWHDSVHVLVNNAGVSWPAPSSTRNRAGSGRSPPTTPATSPSPPPCTAHPPHRVLGRSSLASRENSSDCLSSLSCGRCCPRRWSVATSAPGHAGDEGRLPRPEDQRPGHFRCRRRRRRQGDGAAPLRGNPSGRVPAVEATGR